MGNTGLSLIQEPKDFRTGKEHAHPVENLSNNRVCKPEILGHYFELMCAQAYESAPLQLSLRYLDLSFDPLIPTVVPITKYKQDKIMNIKIDARR